MYENASRFTWKYKYQLKLNLHRHCFWRTVRDERIGFAREQGQVPERARESESDKQREMEMEKQSELVYSDNTN